MCVCVCVCVCVREPLSLSYPSLTSWVTLCPLPACRPEDKWLSEDVVVGCPAESGPGCPRRMITLQVSLSSPPLALLGEHSAWPLSSLLLCPFRAASGYIRPFGQRGSCPGVRGCLHSSPLQYSCLVNPMDSGTWQAAVHGITKSQVQLKRLSTHTRRGVRVQTRTRRAGFLQAAES